MIRARVLFARERTRLAWLVGTAGGLVAGFMLLFESPGSFDLAQHVCGTALIVWLLGPLLDMSPKRARSAVREDARGLLIGDLLVPLGSACSVARAARGFSVALETPRGPAFLEVESSEDARRIVRALGAPADRAIVLRLPRFRLGPFVAIASALGLVGALSYVVTIDMDKHLKGGLAVALFFALVSTALFAVQHLVRRPCRLGDDAWAELLKAKAIGADVARHVRLHAESRVSSADAPPEATARVRVLAQQGEPTGAWLARVDALADGGGAYRGDGLDKDELLRIVDDASLPPDARLGSARILARRHGEAREELRLRVGHDLARSLDDVLEDEPELAARRLDARRPLFRAE